MTRNSTENLKEICFRYFLLFNENAYYNRSVKPIIISLLLISLETATNHTFWMLLKFSRASIVVFFQFFCADLAQKKKSIERDPISSIEGPKNNYSK